MSKRKSYATQRPKVKPPRTHAKSNDLIAYQTALRVSVAQSAHLNDSPAIKEVFDDWTAVTDQLGDAENALVVLLQQIEPARSLIGSLRAKYLTQAALFGTTLESVLRDDLPGLQSFGVALQPARGGAPAIVAPVKLRVHPIQKLPGHYTVRWHLVKGAGLYELQRSPEPAAEATYADVYSGTHAEYIDDGPIGEVVWFRVRARGDTASDWSPPVRYVVV
jgi:hypothetical protein